MLAAQDTCWNCDESRSLLLRHWMYAISAASDALRLCRWLDRRTCARPGRARHVPEPAGRQARTDLAARQPSKHCRASSSRSDHSARHAQGRRRSPNCTPDGPDRRQRQEHVVSGPAPAPEAGWRTWNEPKRESRRSQAGGTSVPADLLWPEDDLARSPSRARCVSGGFWRRGGIHRANSCCGPIREIAEALADWSGLGRVRAGRRRHQPPRLPPLIYRLRMHCLLDDGPRRVS